MNNKKNDSFISAIIYIYNQQENIESFIKRIYIELKTHFENFEIICIDDGSNDNSNVLIEGLAKSLNSPISLVHIGKHIGIEMSMKAGVDLAIGDFVYEFEKPGLYFDSNLLIDAYYQTIKGYDIVYCTKTNNIMGTSKAYYTIFNHFSDIQENVKSDSFRIISRRAINRVEGMSNTTFFRKALYANCGLKSTTLEYHENKASKQERQFSKSRTTMAVNAMLLFTNIGYKFSTTCTIFMSLFSVSVLFYTFYVYLDGQTVAGWTPIMLFLSFSFMSLFALLSIMIKYLDLLLKLSFKKYDYIIENIQKITN